jgi:hypothetical protein
MRCVWLQITEIALRRLGMDVLPVSNPQTLADTMSVFYDEGGKPALEKEALLGIFKSWIAPFTKSSFIQNREDWKPPRTSYHLTRENEGFNSEISGAYILFHSFTFENVYGKGEQWSH